MKKLLALIIALMLPVTAFAQSYCFEMKFDVVKEVFHDLFMSQLADETIQFSGVNAEKVLDAVVRIIDDMGMSLQLSQDAAAFEFQLDGKPFIDYTGYVQNDELLITTSMVPKAGLVFPIPQYTEEDMTVVMRSLENAWETIDAWCISLPYSASTDEVFNEFLPGACSSVKYMFYDETVADLADDLLSDLVPAIRTIFQTDDLSELLEYAEECSKNAREQNLHAYQLTMLLNEETMDWCLTLDVLREGEKVTTASLVLQNEDVSIRLVTGTGIQPDVNLWTDMQLSMGDLTNEDMTLHMVTESFTGPKGMSFTEASNIPGNNKTSYLHAYRIWGEEDGLCWDYMRFPGTPLEGTNLMMYENVDINSTGVVTVYPEVKANNVVSYLHNDETFMTMNLSVEPSDPIQAPADDLKRIDLYDDSPESKEAFYDFTDTLSRMMMVRLIKQLPLDVLMSIPNLFTIE